MVDAMDVTPSISWSVISNYSYCSNSKKSIEHGITLSGVVPHVCIGMTSSQYHQTPPADASCHAMPQISRSPFWNITLILVSNRKK